MAILSQNGRLSLARLAARHGRCYRNGHGHGYRNGHGHGGYRHQSTAASPSTVCDLEGEDEPTTTTNTGTNTTTTTSRNFRRSKHTASPIYVAATREHVGKTSTSIALLSGLQKRFENVGFMKPVGQNSLQVYQEDGILVNIDKDAVLVKEHFGLHHLKYKAMSPVLIPSGYTRNYLDGKIRLEHQEELVTEAYREISSTSQIVLCEGTGHCAVGSIVHASNAQVASWLNAKMVLVANGGLGNTVSSLLWGYGWIHHIG
jgi:dethiobiotin synthetase